MATWQKVIVSGSAAHLLNVTASNLTDNELVIAGPGGALENSGLTYNGTTLNLGSAQVQAAGFSGSFSGSFQGNGSGLTGIVATGTSLQNAITNGEGIAPFSYTNIAPVSVAVSGAADLNDNVITKWDNDAGKFQNSSLTDNGTAITGTTSIQLSGANSSLTGSFTGSFIGDGSGLTGLPSTLTVDGDTGTENVNLILDDLQFIGTANEVNTAVTKVGTDVKVTIGLPNDVVIGNNLTVTNDLIVNGTATYINTQNLYVEDPFILLASGSTSAGDGGIVIDRGSDSDANIAFGYDAGTDRWGFQNGLADNVTSINLADGTGTSAAFAGLVFTETSHGATKPTTGEFAKLGSIYTATNEDIWIYS
jgi:hypothetical protein